MLCKDEVDIVETTVRHLLYHVDEVIVADNASSDGTLEILRNLANGDPRVQLRSDPEVGYYQDRKTTGLAMEALERGHQWVVPCDADEIWHAPDPEQPIRDWLAGLGRDVMMVRAAVFNHLPSSADPPVANPVLRIGWRQRQPGMTKVACRLRPDLWIEMGNHDARVQGQALKVAGLNVRHFSWRTEAQYLRKIRNGREAYEATDLPETYGVGWRMWVGRPDDEILDHYRRWFVVPDPFADDTLIRDPAPVQNAGL